MRSITTRLIIVIASLLIAIIIGMQVHWLDKSYTFEKHEFNTSVLKAIRGVYEDIPLLYNTSSPLDSLVERNSESSFIFGIDSLPTEDSLIESVTSELEDFRVFTDCRLAVYDHTKDKYVYMDYISADASNRNEDTVSRIPLWKRNFSYVHLYFPNRQQYIIREMQNWIYSSSVLLVLLLGFSMAIYYFVKQKFLVEIQKDFINNVTHEFSTPLSVIDLSIEGLEKPSILTNPEKHARYVSTIKYQSAYLNNHIQNLVKTVVVGQYHLSLQKKEIVINDLLKRAVIQLEPLLLKKNGEVIWQLESGNTVVQADEENTYLVFFNIINNAIKYAEVPMVTISTVVHNDRYFITVKDNGAGIEPSQQKKIFRKFYRAPNLNHVKGLGLGLYFSKKVIEAHQGHIRVNSIPDIGTAFIIDIPLKYS
jgi:two-component system phosphate regulon sensor histidine kinase PhoR